MRRPSTASVTKTSIQGVAYNPDTLANAIISLLAIVNIARTLRHAMWRDELQIFMLASGSPSLWDLFVKLKYEAHPGLWHTLVWVLSRATSEPMWMQVLHIVLALAAWFVICRWSPFSSAEKLLIVLSYFLFWEYFVISRAYVLLALIGFAFVAARGHRPQQRFVPWLLLGLLANVHVFGAIWSIALGFSLALQGERWNRGKLAGIAVYVALFVLAVATMLPAPDYGPLGEDARFDVVRFNQDLAVPLGAFVPTNIDAVKETIAFLAHPHAAAVPRFWNADPAGNLSALLRADTDHPLRLVFIYALPLLAVWLITRDRFRFVEFALAYAGILLFANIWEYPGSARHHGVVFLALICSVWLARGSGPAPRRPAWLFMGLLAINAFAGVLTLASESRPFSESRSAAAWIKESGLAESFLIGSRDAQASAVTGYLGRPVYYLECECRGTYIVWNHDRQSSLSRSEFARRLASAVALAERRDAILIRNRPVTPDDLASDAPGLSVTLLKTFAGANTDENYWIYRVSE